MASSQNNPVVLIHGWAGNFKDTWQKTGLDALLEDMGRTVIPLNLLGHGDEEKPHDPESYGDLPNWLLAKLPQDQVVDVVAFSLGALTTLRALVNHADRFGKIVLAGIGDGVFSPSDPANNQRIVDALEGRLDESDSFAHTFAHYGNQPGNDVLALTAIMKRPASEPMLVDQCESVSNDVLIVIGDKDFAGPSGKLADSFPNGKLVELKNTDHFATTDSFSFIDAVLDFLS